MPPARSELLPAVLAAAPIALDHGLLSGYGTGNHVYPATGVEGHLWLLPLVAASGC
jgi:hypothetical protein